MYRYDQATIDARVEEFRDRAVSMADMTRSGWVI